MRKFNPLVLVRSFFGYCLRVLIRSPQLDVPLTRIALTFRFAESNRFAHRSARKLGFRALDLSTLDFLPPLEERKVLFVLGKGPSRAQIIQEHREEITAGYSVGINDFEFVDFEPNAESRESETREETLRRISGGEDWPTRPLRSNKIEGADPPHLVPRGWRRNTWILQKATVAGRGDAITPAIAQARRRLVRIYSSVGLLTSDAEKVGRNFRFFGETLGKKTTPAVLFGSEASVLRMVNLGVIAGFEKIVLVGIDLRGQLPQVADSPRGENHWVHKTARKQSPHSIPVQEALRGIVSISDGVEFFVGHRDSLLAEWLPVYPWKSNDVR